MSKHTPGPWRWWTSNSFRRLSSDATRRDGDVLRAEACANGFATVVVSEDDARVIEAAPELLEALVDCRRALEVANFTQELAIVDVAIAKATGGPA